MSSDSATALATQQSIKAYIATQVATVDTLAEILANGNTAGTDINFADNDKVIFGAGTDLQIYHSGSNSIIKENGTGDLRIQGDEVSILNSAGTENKARFTSDAAVKLFYDNAEKIKTTTGGVEVTGNIVVSGTVDGRDLQTDGTKLDGITASATELAILDGATVTTAELNLLDGVTSTTAELNILDGVTSTAAELNILDGVTSTTAELNILDGVTATTAELNILDGVTASAADINLIDGITNGTVIASKAIITDANKDITGGRNITITGELDAASLDISGNADIDGTLETDALSINGTTVTSTAAELNLLDGVTATTAELNILDGVTSTAAELNILDGVTATATELNILDGVTATTAELNYVDGVTSAIQTQLDAKAALASPTFTGTVTVPTLNVSGNLTVSGTTTTLNTATLDVEDKNITLNYGSGDTSGSANGAGITIQDAVNSSTDATILWDATNDEFDFSHPINVTGAIQGTSLNINGTAVTATAAELNYVDGVTSNIQTQLDAKAPLASPTFTGTVTTAGLTVGDGSGSEEILVDAGAGWADLKLNSDATNGGHIYFNDGADAGQIFYYHPDNSMRFHTDTSEAIRITSAQKVGIGLTDPDEMLEVFGDVKIGQSGGSGVLHFGNTSDKTKIVGRDSSHSSYPDTLAIFTDNTQRMTIDASGNVGIADSTPSAKLDVNGSVLLQGGSFSAGIDSGTAGIVLQQDKPIFSRDVSGNYLRNLIKHESGGDITIGQSGTSLITGINLHAGSTGKVVGHSELRMNDSVTFSLGSSSDVEHFWDGSNYYTDINGGANWYLRDGNSSNNSEFLFDIDNGHFHADGNIYAYSTSTNSDIKLKDNIATIENPFEVLNGIKGCSWTWKKDGSEGAGVIAQEVEKVMPSAVSDVDELNSEETVKTVEYNQLIGVLIEAVKELKAEVEELKGGK